jgi:hypothetical protein
MVNTAAEFADVVRQVADRYRGRRLCTGRRLASHASGHGVAMVDVTHCAHVKAAHE